MKANKLLSTLGLAALLLIAVVGCSDDDDNGVNATSQTARVFITHASPDAPGVDIFVDNAPVAAVNDLKFPNATGYVELPAGSRNIKLAVTNQGIGNAVLDQTLALTANTDYTVFAVDSVSRLDLLVLVDDLTAPAAGKAHVRFVHLSPNAPEVDVVVTGGPDLFTNRAFKTATAFTPVDAGTYNLEVQLSSNGTVVLPLPNITLQDGKIYTVFAKGFAGGTGNQALGAEIIVNN